MSLILSKDQLSFINFSAVLSLFRASAVTFVISFLLLTLAQFILHILLSEDGELGGLHPSLFLSEWLAF